MSVCIYKRYKSSTTLLSDNHSPLSTFPRPFPSRQTHPPHRHAALCYPTTYVPHIAASLAHRLNSRALLDATASASFLFLSLSLSPWSFSPQLLAASGKIVSRTLRIIQVSSPLSTPPSEKILPCNGLRTRDSRSASCTLVYTVDPHHARTPNGISLACSTGDRYVSTQMPLVAPLNLHRREVIAFTALCYIVREALEFF